MSHSLLYYLCSADLSKSFSLLCQYLSFRNTFINRICPVQKCGVTQHFLYRDLLTLSESFLKNNDAMKVS